MDHKIVCIGMLQINSYTFSNIEGLLMILIHAPFCTHHDRARFRPVLFKAPCTQAFVNASTFQSRTTKGGLYVHLSSMAYQVTYQDYGSKTFNKRMGERIMVALYMRITGNEMFNTSQILPSRNTWTPNSEMKVSDQWTWKNKSLVSSCVVL